MSWLPIPTPQEAAKNIKDKRDARVKAAMDRLRPHVVQAMNTNRKSIRISEALNPPNNAFTQGNQLYPNQVETYADVGADAARALIPEIEAQGWDDVVVNADQLSWREPIKEET
jgi:hypothetical protein